MEARTPVSCRPRSPRAARVSLAVVAFAYILLLLVWIGGMAAVPSGEMVEEGLRRVLEHPVRALAGYVNASLLALPLSFILIFLAWFDRTGRHAGMREMLGIFFLAPYVTLVSVAYASQYTVLPRMLQYADEVDLPVITQWYFGSYHSVPLALDLLGYAFFGLSALCIGSRFLRQRPLERWIGIFLCLSGITSIAAFVGFAAQNLLVESWSLVSGALTLPFAVLVALHAVRRCSSAQGEHA